MLRSAFPQVELLRIELTFEDLRSISPVAQVHQLYPAARAFFTYRCPHSDCDGEFKLERAVSMAVCDSSRTAQGSLICAGTRPAEKGSRRPCELRLLYAITARYHSGT